MRRVLLFLLGVLLAGCSARDPDSLKEDEGAERTDASFLEFEHCSEMNFPLERPEATTELPAFMRPARTADAATSALLTIFGCDEGRSHLRRLESPAAYTYLYPVDELDFLRLPGSAGYLFLATVRTADKGIAAAFASWATVEDVSLELSFSDAGTMRRAQGDATIVAPNARTQYHTMMAQPGSPGTGGVLGMYTITTTHVQLHSITFGDYFGYEAGAGVIIGASTAERAGVEAFHNIDYDVRFDLAVGGAPRSDRG